MLLRYIVFYCESGCDTSEPHVSYISRACSSLVRQSYYIPNRFSLKIRGLVVVLTVRKVHWAGRASNQPSGLLLSPRVPTRRKVYRGSCKSKDFMAFLFCKPWLHGFCTVFARWVFSMSDDVGRCIALQSVPFFASGEQCQAEFCLHFRVGILQQFQKSRHGGLSFALRLIGETLLR